MSSRPEDDEQAPQRTETAAAKAQATDAMTAAGDAKTKAADAKTEDGKASNTGSNDEYWKRDYYGEHDHTGDYNDWKRDNGKHDRGGWKHDRYWWHDNSYGRWNKDWGNKDWRGKSQQYSNPKDGSAFADGCLNK